MTDIADGSIISGVRVLVRVRPPLKALGESGADTSHIEIGDDNRSLSLKVKDSLHQFTFDTVLGHSATQEEIYDRGRVDDLITHVINGYNATIFAYGQTGSGKTYTMGGIATGEGSAAEDVSNLGITARALHSLFTRAPDASVTCSFVQIYQEQVYDLLAPVVSIGSKDALRVRWSAAQDFHIPTLTHAPCVSAAVGLRLFAQGNQRRVTAQHRLNAASSRSHTVLTLTVRRCTDAGETTSKLCVVDLAGSERVAHTGADGTVLSQAIGINQSLFVLRKVVKALATGAQQHVPYRDATLTRLLKHALGGNSVTLMVACVNPVTAFAEETLSTLNYAAMTGKIVNRAKPVEDERAATIRRLTAENRALRDMLSKAKQLFLQQPATPSTTPTSDATMAPRDGPLAAQLSHKLATAMAMAHALLSENARLRVESSSLEERVRTLEEEREELEFDNGELSAQNAFLEDVLVRGAAVDGGGGEGAEGASSARTEAKASAVCVGGCASAREAMQLRALLVEVQGALAHAQRQQQQLSQALARAGGSVPRAHVYKQYHAAVLAARTRTRPRVQRPPTHTRASRPPSHRLPTPTPPPSAPLRSASRRSRPHAQPVTPVPTHVGAYPQHPHQPPLHPHMPSPQAPRAPVATDAPRTHMHATTPMHARMPYAPDPARMQYDVRPPPPPQHHPYHQRQQEQHHHYYQQQHAAASAPSRPPSLPPPAAHAYSQAEPRPAPTLVSTSGGVAQAVGQRAGYSLGPAGDARVGTGWRGRGDPSVRTEHPGNPGNGAVHQAMLARMRAQLG